MPDTTTTRGRLATWLGLPSTRFGGVYGLLISSTVLAAISDAGSATLAERRDDALWVLFAAVAGALAHGYAHYAAHHSTHHEPGRGAGSTRTRRPPALVRAVLDEWLLLAAAVPAVVVLLGAGWGLWPSHHAEDVALGLNTVLLLLWGLLVERSARSSWPTALAWGCADALLGLVVAAVNVLLK